MGTTTKIQWAHHTANAWIGCTKVSPGCDHCYAECGAQRLNVGWGDHAQRLLPLWDRLMRNVLAWDRAAEQAGVRRRVFWNSYSDFLEKQVEVAHRRLLACGVMEATRHLDHLILTKRPENWRLLPRRWEDEWPAHIWFGVTVETQEWADRRIPFLLPIPARVRFVSAEPLLGRVDLDKWVFNRRDVIRKLMDVPMACNEDQADAITDPVLDWVIVGGESGPRARPCDVAWIRSIVQQCRVAGVACFVKQLGANIRDRNDAGFDGDEFDSWPADTQTEDNPNGCREGYQGAPVRVRLRDRKGGDPSEWPTDLRVRKFPR